MKNRGFTLLELMVSIAVLTIVSGALYTASMTLTQAARSQEAKTATIDHVQGGMLLIARNIRQASSASVNWGALPGPVLSYRAAADIDGNGTAVDIGVELELGPVRTLTRDVSDLNGDGVTDTQLILVEDGQVRVIANGLLLDEDLNQNDVLDAGEDTNQNGVLDHGIWFRQAGQGVRVTLQCEQATMVQGRPVNTGLFETVFPRN